MGSIIDLFGFCSIEFPCIAITIRISVPNTILIFIPILIEFSNEISVSFMKIRASCIKRQRRNHTRYEQIGLACY